MLIVQLNVTFASQNKSEPYLHLSGIAAPEQNIELAQFVWGGRRFCWYDSALGAAQAGSNAASPDGAALAGEVPAAGAAGTGVVGAAGVLAAADSMAARIAGVCLAVAEAVTAAAAVGIAEVVEAEAGVVAAKIWLRNEAPRLA
jgi:hypothetical protein